MEFKEYKSLVREIKIGKHLPDAVYTHESAINVALPPTLLAYINDVVDGLDISDLNWNIIKFYKRDHKTTLLYYPGFLKNAYPALVKSFTVDLHKGTFRVSNYNNSDNPPILHRKELFLAPNHPSISKFKEITKEGEEAGLYKNTKIIGFKQSWERLINRKGYSLVNGRLKSKNAVVNTKNIKSDEITVQRHLTAIDRNTLSAPMQTLARHNYFSGKYSILDYGSGKGDDVRELEAHGLNVFAWDPVYKPDGKKRKCDIVNLGFVINVIEEKKERDKTLKDAFKSTKKLLAVSAMVGGDNIVNKFVPYKDGTITSRNTFQKYYSQSELKDYIESTLDNNAIAVSLGVLYVFKDKQEEQKFLIERQTAKHAWNKLTEREIKTPKVLSKELIEKNKDLFNDFWKVCLDLGRLPAISEFEFSDQIRRVSGSHNKAFQYIKEYNGIEEFEKAQKRRHEDLIVYFALSLFAKRKPFSHMPESLKRDLKVYFGNYPTTLEEAEKLLFSIGTPSNIEKACEESHASLECGVLSNGHSYTVHRMYLNMLPPLLRIYVGCSTQLYGDMDEVDVIKIHITSGKVSLMIYDDFDNKPLPLLLKRIKINMRFQKIEFFEYGEKYPPQPLYLKSIYMKNNFPNYEKQLLFDEQIKSFKSLNLDEFGPSHECLLNFLSKQKLKIKGFFIKKS